MKEINEKLFLWHGYFELCYLTSAFRQDKNELNNN